jgi:hypothetical protein
MQEIETHGTTGLALEELEAYSRIELLPDRLEMRRRRRRNTNNIGNQNCSPTNTQVGGNNTINQNNQCANLFASSASASASSSASASASTSASASASASATASATTSATASALAYTGGPPAVPIAGAAGAGLIASGLAALKLVLRRSAS